MGYCDGHCSSIVACATRLEHGKAGVPIDALNKTAKLFRTFGEDYHERKLEEAFIFPVVRKVNSDAAGYPNVLVAQHDLGRQLTDYVMTVTASGSIAEAHVRSLARALDQFELMYEHHMAREDTVVFTAWKNALSKSDYKDMGEKFEDIEKQTFGHDGFDDAVQRIAVIEESVHFGGVTR
jgi:hemerythrin-like domain-containing protein